MVLCSIDQDKKRLIKRLHRIEGQIRGLCSMIEKDRDCIEVLRQITSVSGALRGVWVQVVKDHLKGCIQKAVLNGEQSENLIDELADHLGKIR
ncbi:metal-sensitive transcriptional regulator [bacterium]|nr:metal-sensitive transcriptional regulator [bacterium]MBU1024930.1 metal-sensitive transcriptional regulator [bacterium]